MRFQVPQFIEVEDKIFGPLTLKQFIYLAGGVGICATAWVFLKIYFAILIIAPVAVFSLMLAFYKINNRPFIYTVEAFFNYSLKKKLYIWQKDYQPKKEQSETIADREESLLYIPNMSSSKLKDLTWNLDVPSNQNPITSGTIGTKTIQTMQHDIEIAQSGKKI